MIRSVLVLGGGSAGFLAAIALKVRLPQLEVRVVHSSRIGIIAVGEGTTFSVPKFLHGYLGIDPAIFHARVRPTYKLGIRFLWGPRPRFHYTFTSQLDARSPQLPKANGYYCDEQFDFADLTGALMAHDRAFERRPDGGPFLSTSLAYHVENETFVGFLHQYAEALGIQIVDDTLQGVDRNEQGVAALHMESGQTLTADLYVDCSGFRSELVGKALGEPFIPFGSSLFCDRALAGGWPRTDEPLKPYTTAESMDAGWAWQIEHDHLINRGYVYSSAHISDAEAEQEFRHKNPKVKEARVIRFVSGRYRTAWVGNAVALGNAAGFVEPLEATALALVCEHVSTLIRTLVDSDLRIKPTQRQAYNAHCGSTWDAVRRFLALHYKLNTRLDTPFWRDCRETTDLAGCEPMLEFYRENGPSRAWRNRLLAAGDPFGWEGYLIMLVGLGAPYDRTYQPGVAERSEWSALQNRLRTRAAAAMPLDEALAVIRSNRWVWQPDFYRDAQ